MSDTLNTLDTIKNTARNTNKDSAVRSRMWFLTHNNYTQEDIDTLTQVEGDFIFQEEVGENGTPHLQGFIKFKNARTFLSMKKINGKTHWEKAKNPEACKNYCQKLKTRVGKIHTNREDWIKTENQENAVKTRKLTENEIAIRCCERELQAFEREMQAKIDQFYEELYGYRNN